MLIKVVRLNQVPILKQLQLEEALLRAGDDNYLIINTNAPPAVIFGISGKVDEHLETFPTIAVIRRFSGGGTVVVDEETLYISFICNKADTPCKPYPKQILHYAAHPYKNILPDFRVSENDYTINDTKFAGNAQSITNKRWIHHSTLLWDFCPVKMNMLKLPPTMPAYREKRSHSSFLTTLKKHFIDKESFLKLFIENIEAEIVYKDESAVLPLLKLPHRKATKQLKGAENQLTNTVS